MNKLSLVLPFAFLALAACGETQKEDPPKGPTIPEKYWAAEAPSGASDIAAARKAAKDGAEMTVIGLVQDFSKTQSQFFVADRALIPCNEREGDNCPTPWDYCCEDKPKLQAGLLTVELRDGKKLIKSSLEGFHGFTHLKEAIVKGKAEVDSSGNVVLVAHALHIREAKRGN